MRRRSRVALVAQLRVAPAALGAGVFGYARAEVLSAFVNALAMLALVVFIAVEAVRSPAAAGPGGRAGS